MKTFDEILGLTLEQILQEIKKTEHELVGIRMSISAGQEKDSSKRKKAAKYIAQLKTAKRQKELGISPA